ncbi:MAG: PIN domain-containing protein [Nitrococcus mobilis]|nr:PIN domain-containing protein [Nitrococcus mobilis]
MRVALDTNVLVYAEGYGDSHRCERAQSLVDALPVGSVIIPAQCLGELFRVLHGKGGLGRAPAADRVLQWTEIFTIADSSSQAFLLALELVRSHRVQVWDALIACVASVSQCRLLVTEDFPGTSTLAGVRIADPFTDAGFDNAVVTALR